jgi:MoxR-like ATPase
MTTEATTKKLIKLQEEIKKIVIGRDDVIEALVLGIASNQHILLLGKHGEAKSFLVEHLAKATDLKYFYSQIHQETIVKDIVGLLNPVEYQKGKLDIIKTLFWNSDILFFDEFLRGRSEFLDFLLEVMVERKTSKTLLGESKLPVISVIATSNPLTDDYNTERLDLALKDRFYAILSLEHLIQNDEKHNDIKAILVNDKNKVENVGLTREELKQFYEHGIASVKVDTDVVVEIFVNAKNMGFPFSTRFIKMFKEVAQIYALIHGKNEVSKEDIFSVSVVMLMNRFEGLTKNKIENIVDEAILKESYADVVKEIRTLGEIKANEDEKKVFIEKSVELIGKVKYDYATMPNRLKEKIDQLTTDLQDIIRLNVDDNSIITASIIGKLDTEQFKPIIEQFIEHHTIKTRYMNEAEYTKIKLSLKFVRNCEITKERASNFVKMVIKPKIDSAKSFDEIKDAKQVLADKKMLLDY